MIQDEGGEERRRKRRRDREHGADSAHSYYSVVSEGGTRHVRRRKRHEDGTYSRSESYHSSRSNGDDKDDVSEGTEPLITIQLCMLTRNIICMWTRRDAS